MNQVAGMKHQRLGLLLMLVANIAPVCYGQDSLGALPKKARTAADYQPGTMKDITAGESETRNPLADFEKDSPTGGEKIIVNGNVRPSRVSATYAGRSRPMPQNKQKVLHRWAQLYAGEPAHYTVPYQSEVLFKADGLEYWLAVRKDSLAKFNSDIKAGNTVDLFLIRLGGYLETDKWEALLLVESFEKP